MTFDKFKIEPFKQSHPSYLASFLQMRPAVEYASGEHLLASTYRAVGDSNNEISEGRVPQAGRDFDRLINRGRRPSASERGTDIDSKDWIGVVKDTLRSPKQPNQATRRFLQISPLVPDAALYSLSARLSANSWNPGDLVRVMILYGCDSHGEAEQLWLDLFQALKIDSRDDLWARFLDKEFRSWREKKFSSFFEKPSVLKPDDGIDLWRKTNCRSPASRFCKDLRTIINLKTQLTRRQWVTLVESVIRIGSASLTMWLATVNKEVDELLYNASMGLEWTKLELDTGLSKPFLEIDQYVSAQMKHVAINFEKARLRINFLLYTLEQKKGADFTKNVLSDIDKINAFASNLTDLFTKDERTLFKQEFQILLEQDNKRFQGKASRPKNILEFLQHSLQQRRTSEVGLESYDQGFFLRKRGIHRNARWEVSLGPAAVLALVHACTSGRIGVTNMDDFMSHIREYGLALNPENKGESSLIETLRSLGLVLDSPDAEGGMTLNSAFDQVSMEQEG